VFTAFVNAVLSHIHYNNKQFVAEAVPGGGCFIHVASYEIDHEDGLMKHMKGRRWYVPEGSSGGEIARTAFLAVMTWEEHEIREMFLYDGNAIFSPHFDVDVVMA
jgi:hypothetical protein